jgi:hypothetical protein
VTAVPRQKDAIVSEEGLCDTLTDAVDGGPVNLCPPEFERLYAELGLLDEDLALRQAAGGVQRLTGRVELVAQACGAVVQRDPQNVSVEGRLDRAVA